MSESTTQRILVIGAGAIGCTLAWHLSSEATQAAGIRVTLLARTASQQAIERNGLTLWQQGQSCGTHQIATTSSMSKDQPWDAIILCVKQYDLSNVLHQIAPLLQPSTALIPLVNGIPWWLMRSHPQLRDQTPERWGSSYARFPELAMQQVIGGVIHIPAHMRDYSNVEQGQRNTLALGEITRATGDVSARVQKLANAFHLSALQCKASPDIQSDVWNKLLGNAVFNPVSALANANMREMLSNPGLRELCERLMTEVMAVGQALDYPQEVTVEERLIQAQSAGDARTSMLQDAIAGKPLEGETLIGSVTHIAAHLNEPTPALNGIWALLQSRFSGSP